MIPKFKNTQEAILYGIVISEEPFKIEELRLARFEYYKLIEELNKQKEIDFNRVCVLATSAQLCREAIETAEFLIEQRSQIKNKLELA